MTLIDQIRDMIAEGETEKSLEELYAYVKENNADIIDQLVMLRNRNRNLQRSVQMGTMDAQDAALERAKINEAILKLLPQLTPEYLAQASRRLEIPAAAAAPSVHRVAAPTEAAPARKSFMPYLIGGGAVLLLLVLVALFSGGSEEPAPSTTVTEAEPESAQMDAPAAGGSSSSNAQPQSSGQEQSAVTEATNDDLLSQVLAAHGGHALWEMSGGRGYIEVDAQAGTAQEYGANGEVNFSFQVQSADANYITLYDASRHIRLRIGESDALFRYDSDSEWKRMATGRWVTPE